MLRLAIVLACGKFYLMQELDTINSKVHGKSDFHFKFLQGLFWFIGVFIIGLMIFIPPIGAKLFWNIIIPVAPALLVLAAGFWRNVCPLGTTSLLPDKFRMSRNIKLTSTEREVLNLVAVSALFVIIPLRHIYFNSDGRMTAYLLLVIASIAVVAGYFFERKSGWCSGLCPVHPVEKLYGSAVALTVPNMHCGSCVHCSAPCPDTTVNFSFKQSKLSFSKINKYLLVGVFPGYVWGWFQTSDFIETTILDKLFIVYRTPIMGGLTTLMGYLVLRKLLGKNRDDALLSVFAAATVSCYYWFRLPQLIGFEKHDTNGILVNLTFALPEWTPVFLHITSTSFFLWWMVVRKKNRKSWSWKPVPSRVNVQ